MIPSKDPVFAESVEQFQRRIKAEATVRLEPFQQFRKTHEARLLRAHQAGGGGRQLVRYRSDVVDVVLRELFEKLREEVHGDLPQEPLAVVASGGYGRRELNPFSDVDITFLTEGNQPGDRTEELIRRYVMILWDVGFKVGHSVRSVRQAVQQSNEDLLTKTSLLEARFLCGRRELFQEFRKRFADECIRGRENEFVAWRKVKVREQYEKSGASVYMQEPNIKSGCGGLRDYQNLLWVARVTHGIQTTAKLVEKKLLRDSERRRLGTAYDFLLRTRTQLHYLNKRPADQLTLQMQGRVATAFGYPQKHILRRCEEFMRDYYRHAREIHLLSQAVLARLTPSAPQPRRGILRIFTRGKKEEQLDGLVVRDGMLLPSGVEIFTEDPPRMMRLFHHAQRRQLMVSEGLLDLVRRRLRLVDRTFQYAKENREVFLSILSHKGAVGRILRDMHNAGFLGRFLPEFEPLTCLVQHEFFHRYTVDEHTLVCIDKLDGVLLTEQKELLGYRDLFQKLEDPAILYLALLLHDTGKAANSRHHEEASAECAQKAARRLQLSPERRRMLINLVNNHYVLSQTAQTRNLEDPATVLEFAGIVQNRRNLDALMLLTLADGMGTSDEKWSDWKESLVWNLYGQTCRYFDTGSISFDVHRESIEETRRMVAAALPGDFSEEISAHFQHMPERYFLGFDARDIQEHLHLFRRFLLRLTAGEPEIWKPEIEWIDRPNQGHTEVRLCGWDRDALLERVAGAFVASEVNILSADAFTRGDNLVLDIFRVCDRRHQPVSRPRDRNRFEDLLGTSLHEHTYDFRPYFRHTEGLRFYRLSYEAELPTRITIQNEVHPIYSLIEIRTPDRLGLLYDLLGALGEAELTIELSRITTEMDVAMDTFYVTRRDGGKVTSEVELAKIQDLLQRAAIRDRNEAET
jgi:[protein-PII] uridylyltransferase